MTYYKSHNEYTKSCVHCKTSGYRWGKHVDKWRLYNRDGSIHECLKKISKKEGKSFTQDEVYGNSNNYTFDSESSYKNSVLSKGNWKYIHSTNYDHDFFIVEYKDIEVGRILYHNKKYNFYKHKDLGELELIALGVFCDKLNEILGLL
ncbi:MAG: hypothetical protein E6R13_06610 [Spirochaetes bacterium]|jgi:hypothetical protein|nr:MAG: hypothetical protein E6R13_06610 [Spirochaetota bacterium]